MEAIIERISCPYTDLFISKVVGATWFETHWHMHEENDLMLFSSGRGQIFMSDKSDPIESGDVYYISSKLSRRYRLVEDVPISAIVVQFRVDCLGSQFMGWPECQLIKRLLENTNGFLVTGKCKMELQMLIKNIEQVAGIARIITLLQCLQYLVIQQGGDKDIEQIDDLYYRRAINKVLHFTSEKFHTPLTLQQVASIAYMSVSTFCHYFKLYNDKTYIDYLNEIRIEHACRLLRITNKTVAEIGYESGYNTIAHFHRQFLKLKNITPSQYRKIKQVFLNSLT